MPQPPTSPVRLIGYGACGAIFARDDATNVFKLAKTRNYQLWNDYVQHTCVWEAIHAFGLYHETAVPRPGAFVAAEDVEGGEGEGRARQWWSRHGDLAAAVAAGNNVNMPTAVLSSEKIIPLPLPLRNALIQRFCHPDNQAAARASPGNADCLVRIYLGSYSRRTRDGSGGGSGAWTNRFFSLRNFKLYLDQLRELRVDTHRLARYMAGALAAMHWGARVDARDVEFVVGSPPSSPPSPPRSSWIPLSSALLKTMAPNTSTFDLVYPRQPDTPLRFWLLDFNQCGDMSFDEAGVRRAVDAFWMNDPYYPRPPRRDGVDDFEGALWDTFVARFLEISEMILAGEEPGVRNLPAMFVDALVERARR
ncbi:zinc finger protein-domain-containing protein [Phyllosticta citribraziliensis]|uniref:Zinc finger protein-domain-containing protein n=1 Tax=Phyllosticta citribraziliensis TaxID=989973 RepID=A0ABR1L7S4_9PEZI